ncbi:MAG: hypothetical protein C0613_01895 [Desulfobulbaceae bacterium]|nr:MAG: hypothetical protein C0613_01895 [Desulfobulbaceae bacterium]
MNIRQITQITKIRQIRLNAFLIIGLVGLLTVGSALAVQLYRAFGGSEEDIWWTARHRPLELEQTKGAFELLILNKSIRQHVAEGSLYVVTDETSYGPLHAGDMAVRLNGWPKAQASMLAYALVPCFLCGASVAFLLVGLLQALRPEEEAPAREEDETGERRPFP